MTDSITIAVNPDLADACRAVLALFLDLRLRDVTRIEGSIHDVIAEITRTALARGLTTEILQELLGD